MSRDLVSLGTHLSVIDDLYRRYQEDPNSVDASWQALFRNGADGSASALSPPPVSAPAPAAVARPAPAAPPAPAPTQPAPAPVETAPALAPLPCPDMDPAVAPGAGKRNPHHVPDAVLTPGTEAAAMFSQSVEADAGDGRTIWPLVNAYRVRGHMAANLDPLGIIERPRMVELELGTYGFSEADREREFPAAGLHGFDRAPLGRIIDHLQATYAANIGVEFMHMSSPVRKAWLADRMERMHQHHSVDARTKREMLEMVVEAETFERFCHIKYPGTKRFSLEGSEGLLPLVDLVLTHAARLGAIEAVIGMAHRGRLNVLVNIMKRQAREVFAEFEDVEPEAITGGGDVKYHLGYSCERVDRNNRKMHLSLTFNPSHLEAVDPVVVGRTRAKQRRYRDWEHRRVVGIIIHGDAAFAGQGLVAETLNLTNLHGYRTGGTLHIIVNNQIGFTASPHEARSTPYCTDIAKMIQCPIFHVNGEDLDALAHTIKIAMEYRAQFQSDVLIDMFCYRQFGHNEMDEPAFTQPLMYHRIRQKKPITAIYGAQLVAEGVMTAGDIDAVQRSARNELDEALKDAKSTTERPKVDAMSGVWSNYVGGPEADVADVETGVARERLSEIAASITSLPKDLNAHRKIERLLAQRAAMGRGEQAVDWGMAETLAYGTLLWDGHPVRLSGQDSSRGTFSHRHAVVVDIDTGSEYTPLNHLCAGQAECYIYDSPLSEAGVLGYEFGYSLDYPEALVIWEAQFGDFVNGAQVILDQFVFSSEDKWNRLSGLTLFLPHGYEGQGPEHSSARIERFLQSAGQDNMQVCQPTTAAQCFHLLRRQVMWQWRKPLVIFTPKSLLRAAAATSPLEDLTRGKFQRVLDDAKAPPADTVEQIIFCTGKVAYELDRARTSHMDSPGPKRDWAPHTAIVRMEQLYPFPAQLVRDIIDKYARARMVTWVQEEPYNMGANEFACPRLQHVIDTINEDPNQTRQIGLRTATRVESASPATGSHKAHAIEQTQLLDDALSRPD